MPDNVFYSTGVDGKGIFYAGSVASLYVEKNARLVNISPELGLIKSFVASISKDKAGFVWVCPNYDKLYQIKQNSNGIYYKSDSLGLNINGLPFTVLSIAFDSSGNLWAAGRNNLVIYLLQPSGKFLEAKKIVLSKPQFLMDGNDDRILLNTSEDKSLIYLGNTAFNANEVTKKYYVEVPKLALTDILLANKKNDWRLYTDSIDQYGIPTALSLKGKENNIGFYYTSISSSNAFLTRYSHKLEGLESDWQPLSDKNVTDYTNLSPGVYTFLLKSINENEKWSEPIKFRFTVLATWYKTPQAMILWGFLIAIFFVAISKYRINKIRYNAKIEKLLIEQELKTLRAQINPHFLQNSLEFLMQSIDKESSSTIQNIVGQLSLYLRKILQLSDKNIISLEDELVFSEDYLSINKMLFKSNFSYSIDIDPTIDTFSIKVPCMLLQPLLENAFKHGLNYKSDQNAFINIKITKQDRFVCCQVTNSYIVNDTINKSDENYIPKGLAITEERLALLYPKEKRSNLLYFKKENNLYLARICIPV